MFLIFKKRLLQNLLTLYIDTLCILYVSRIFSRIKPLSVYTFWEYRTNDLLINNKITSSKERNILQYTEKNIPQFV